MMTAPASGFDGRTLSVPAKLDCRVTGDLRMHFCRAHAARGSFWPCHPETHLPPIETTGTFAWGRIFGLLDALESSELAKRTGTGETQSRPSQGRRELRSTKLRGWRDMPSGSRQISVGVDPPCATHKPTLPPAQCAQLAHPRHDSIMQRFGARSHSQAHAIHDPRPEPYGLLTSYCTES